MPTKSRKVSDNPWGDPQAPIAVKGHPVGRPCAPAKSGPGENPPTAGAPMRQRFKMAGGSAK